MKFADIRKMILRETFQKSTEEQDRQDQEERYNKGVLAEIDANAALQANDKAFELMEGLKVIRNSSKRTRLGLGHAFNFHRLSTVPSANPEEKDCIFIELSGVGPYSKPENAAGKSSPEKPGLIVYPGGTVALAGIPGKSGFFIDNNPDRPVVSVEEALKAAIQIAVKSGAVPSSKEAPAPHAATGPKNVSVH